MKKLLSSLYVLLSLCLIPLAATSQTVEPDTIILSDTLDYDDLARKSVFKGNVIVTRGNLNLHADHVEVDELENGSQQVAATVNSSNRVRIRQETPEKYEIIKGEGLRGEFNSGTEQLTLIGQASLTRYICGKAIDSIQGERVVYNKQSDTYRALGGPDSADSQKRVRSIARPRANIDRAIAECKAKSNWYHYFKFCMPTSSASLPSVTTGSLRAVGLRKTYGKRTVVKDVSLLVNSGEVVGLLGPNGAGKTTSFYMIVGIVPADSGRIEIDGKIITALPMHKRAHLGLSYLPQDASVFRRLNVENNIRAVLELQRNQNGKRLSKSAVEEQLNQLLDDLQIQHIRHNTALSLSGGERRRVEIARALATNPRFILLDEPFAGVDPIAVIEIQRIVQFLKSRQIGVLITDHNVRETLGICDRAYIISDGSVLTSGHPDEIINNEAVRQVYLGKDFKM